MSSASSPLPESPAPTLTDDTFFVSDEIEAAFATAPHVPPHTGDFHAAFPMKDGSVGFGLGDVAGHGPSADAHAQTLCRALVGCMNEGLSPSESLGFVNAAAEMSPEFDGFATVVAGTIAPETGEITYASGGHEPPLLTEACLPDSPRSEREKCVVELDFTGPPLGVIGADEAHYETARAQLPPSGTLLLYTDGITEARRGNEFFGLARLRNLFARVAVLAPLPLVRKIIGVARAFAGQGVKLRDDAALLVLRRRK